LIAGGYDRALDRRHPAWAAGDGRFDLAMYSFTALREPSMPCEQSTDLIAHASTPAAGVHGLSARISAATPGRLTLGYALRADLSRLCLPSPTAGRRVDELWKHTCFEAFIAIAGTSAYHEFNLSPSGDWAAYRFSAYRQGRSPAQLAAAPDIESFREDSRLQFHCSLPWPSDAVRRGQAPLRVALAAVIEADDGRLSYWAVRHAPGKPDFHHPEAFALELTP
jgi:hypothetical protein